MHAVLVGQVDQSRIKRPVVGRGKGDAIPHMIRASLGADRENVRRIDQTELYARDCAAVAVREENLRQ